jgi:hypothetical protein
MDRRLLFHNRDCGRIAHDTFGQSKGRDSSVFVGGGWELGVEFRLFGSCGNQQFDTIQAYDPTYDPG